MKSYNQQQKELKKKIIKMLDKNDIDHFDIDNCLHPVHFMNGPTRYMHTGRIKLVLDLMRKPKMFKR